MFDISKNIQLLSNSKLSTDNPPLNTLLSNIIGAFQSTLVAQQIDYGFADLTSTDTNGTVVNFHIPFSQAIVIATVKKRTGDGYVTINSIDNTQFHAMAYDHTGTRLSVRIDWIAYGTPNTK